MHISGGVLHPAVLGAGFVAAGSLTAWGLRKIEDSDYPRVGIMTAGFFVASLIHIRVPPTSVHLTLNSLVGVALGARCFPAIMVALFLQAALLGHGGLSVVGVNAVIMAVPGFLAGMLMRRGLRARSSGLLPYAGMTLLIGVGTPVVVFSGLSEIGGFSESFTRNAAVGSGLLVVALLILLERLARGGPVFRWGFTSGALAVFGAAAILFAVLAFAPLARHTERQAFREVAYFAFISHVPVMFVEGIIVAFLIRYIRGVAPDILQVSPAEGGGEESP